MNVDMRIDGSPNIAVELRQLAKHVAERTGVEESDFDRQRLEHLGELILIAADMAADIDGGEVRTQPPEVTKEWFNDIMYREFPDGPTS